MLNAKLTATGRHSVRLSSHRLAPFFLPLTLSLSLSPPVSVLSLYRNSLSALPRRTVPNKWWDKKRQAGSSRHERGEDEEGERERRRRVMVEKNYKRFAPLHLDESQIILRPRATSLAKTTKEGVPEEREGERGSGTYVYIPPILKDVNRKNNFCLLPRVKAFRPTDTSANAVFFFNSSNEHRPTENHAEGILIASLMPTGRKGICELGFFVVALCSILELDSYFQRTLI